MAWEFGFYNLKPGARIRLGFRWGSPIGSYQGPQFIVGRPWVGPTRLFYQVTTSDPALSFQLAPDAQGNLGDDWIYWATFTNTSGSELWFKAMGGRVP
jgi:hypothetical protein